MYVDGKEVTITNLRHALGLTHRQYRYMLEHRKYPKIGVKKIEQVGV